MRSHPREMGRTVTDTPSATDLATQELTINMGPQHPSTHGVLRLILTVDGELITKAIPDIGFLHRGIEKICETWTFRQIPVMADRADYLSAFTTEFGLMIAAEELWEIEVPERAEYARVILAELNRLASHFMFYASFGLDVGFTTPTMFGWRTRESIQDLFEEVTGARLLHNYLAVGGLRLDLPPDFKDAVAGLLPEIEKSIDQCNGLITDSEIFQARTKGVNRLSVEEAARLGLTGPMLRATGIARDLRRLLSYSIYDRFDFDIPVGENGDLFDRYKVRMLEMEQSVRIVRQALKGMPDEGPFQGKVPRILRLPEGDAYSRTESPRGDLCIYLVGSGATKAYRVKIRSPAFVAASALEALLPGAYLADAVLIIGSTDVVMGEVDR